VADSPRPLRGRLRDEAQRLQVPIDLVERDYALGHVLAATYERDALATAQLYLRARVASGRVGQVTPQFGCAVRRFCTCITF